MCIIFAKTTQKPVQLFQHRKLQKWIKGNDIAMCSNIEGHLNFNKSPTRYTSVENHLSHINGTGNNNVVQVQHPTSPLLNWDVYYIRSTLHEWTLAFRMMLLQRLYILNSSNARNDKRTHKHKKYKETEEKNTYIKRRNVYPARLGSTKKSSMLF